MSLLLTQADARHLPFADGSVQTCVTSPPYWGLRDYGIGGQLGLEPTPDAYVQCMVSAFREVRRVLRIDGTCWLNLGDSYAGGGNYRGITSENTLSAKQQSSNRGARGTSQLLVALGKTWDGMKAKDLVGIPWRVAFALQADGWYLRSDIIWSKPNPMPESVTDRPTKAHEYVFLLSKSQSYYFDADAVRELVKPNSGVNMRAPKLGPHRMSQDPYAVVTAKTYAEIKGANIRSVWSVPTQSYPGAHFATMPEKLVERCVLAGSKIGDVVMDPFMGSGTVARVALRLGRKAIGCDLNPAYLKLADDRTRVTYGLPLEVA